MVFTCLQYKPFENTVGKGEIARNEQFLLFPQCFLSNLGAICRFHQIRNCHLQTLLVWKRLKFVLLERVKWKTDNGELIYWYLHHLSETYGVQLLNKWLLKFVTSVSYQEFFFNQKKTYRHATNIDILPNFASFFNPPPYLSRDAENLNHLISKFSWKIRSKWQQNFA